MKIFAFPLYTTVSTSFGTDLEIIQQHIDVGDCVRLFTCPACLKACDRNHLHETALCKRCMRKSTKGISYLSTSVELQKINTLSKWEQEVSISCLRSFETVDDLTQWKYEAFDVGYAVLSSLISWKHDSAPNLRENSEFLKNMADASLRLYRSVDCLLRDDKPDVVYVFNGRYSPMRAIVRACQKNSVKVITHDRGRNLQHYATYEDCLPHNIESFNKTLWEKWNEANLIDRRQIADEWFKKRTKGVQGAWVSYVEKQRMGELPSNWRGDCRNLIIFTSSEHEFASIGAEWEGGRLFDTQLSGIKHVVSQLNEEFFNGKTRIYIRIHPNQANAVVREVDDLVSLERAGVYVIRPESKVSSYTLMKECDLVFSFGSTVGIEAAYWGVPSILMGNCFYKNLKATYNPTSLKELQTLLTSDLKPKQRSLAQPYGYHMATLGKPYKYYEPTGILRGKFRGHNLDSPLLDKFSCMYISKLPKRFKIALKRLLTAKR